MAKKIKQEQGKCPACGSDNIRYDGSALEGESIGYDATCEDCDTDFIEWYDLTYSESIIKGVPQK